MNRRSIAPYVRRTRTYTHSTHVALAPHILESEVNTSVSRFVVPSCLSFYLSFWYDMKLFVVIKHNNNNQDDDDEDDESNYHMWDKENVYKS